MTIFIGADHRGFEMKNKLIEYLQEKNIRVEDMGNYQYDPLDDNPDFGQKVAQAVLQNLDNHRGIVICGSGIGVSIAANRFKGIRCALGFDENQVQHGVENDYINVLAIPAEYMDLEKTQRLINAFLSAKQKDDEKYVRRMKKLDTV